MKTSLGRRIWRWFFGPVEPKPQIIYLREWVMHLRFNCPEEWERRKEDIIQAFREGRVR